MSPLVPLVGELEICDICDLSPHAVGCPRHPEYDDERICYVRDDARDEVGPARYWVEDTFALAAEDAGEEPAHALREAVVEFELAIKRGEIRRL